MDYQTVLDDIYREIAPWRGSGTVAGYIPELARVPVDKFGMAVVTVDGRCFTVVMPGSAFPFKAFPSCLPA
jgi:glutaminase